MLSGYLQERTVRAWAAAEALGIGRGGISAVAAATGLSRTTVHTAVNEPGPGHLDNRLGECQGRERVCSRSSSGTRVNSPEKQRLCQIRTQSGQDGADSGGEKGPTGQWQNQYLARVEVPISFRSRAGA